MKTLLQLENVEKYYGSKNNVTKALDKVSFGVDKGEFIAIMGASGSGKTTLLNCISTIDEVSAGNIYLDDINITDIDEKDIAKFRQKNLGFIFQDFNLLDTLTIEENIGIVLTINNLSPEKVQPMVKEIAAKLGIEDILNKYPYQVSGGQKQRCACARAVINKQSLILADEPTGALDSRSAQMLLEVMEDLNQSLEATILMVTHDAFSASYANRILFLKDGKLFNEIIRGQKSRNQFYHEILDVLALLGGDVSNA
ncbi:ABC transporter ATP-binding protein [Breznakia pachnodae]|uniref:ABC transport system ATP-binding protein n=1 Tax=Breznakia pachnodae TaxID=265178 RepID=A0ABU0DYM7_9FIRM|nr:ABC transporter ATP-binding protein [Breznakia pachnodae]MDQ0359742.1 putative ABC transport system ATP-binding protein [Breznakia pachnodae]